jgi:hypothetical protein
VLEVVERLVLVAGRVLDRAADQPDPGGKADRFRRRRRRVAETPFQISRDRQVSRHHDGARMRERRLARHLAVALAERAGARAARGRERLEAKPGENARGACIPRIWNQKGARSLVQRAKAGRLVALRGRHEQSTRLANSISMPGLR